MTSLIIKGKIGNKNSKYFSGNIILTSIKKWMEILLYKGILKIKCCSHKYSSVYFNTHNRILMQKSCPTEARQPCIYNDKSLLGQALPTSNVILKNGGEIGGHYAYREDF